MRSEKDALEAVLFDTANMLEDTDNKKMKLEHELQETLVQQEAYKGNILYFDWLPNYFIFYFIKFIYCWRKKVWIL